MSQKTNPYSLRLQKTNKRFDCSWYSDYFYNEMSNNDYKIRLYIEGVFRSTFSAANQVEHSYEHLSLQNHYKRCLLSLFAIDARDLLHDKLLGLHKMFALFDNHTQKQYTNPYQIIEALSRTHRHIASARLVMSKKTGQTLKLTDQNRLSDQKRRDTKIESKMQLINCLLALTKQNPICSLGLLKAMHACYACMQDKSHQPINFVNPVDQSLIKFGTNKTHLGIMKQGFEELCKQASKTRSTKMAVDKKDLHERFYLLARAISVQNRRLFDMAKVGLIDKIDPEFDNKNRDRRIAAEDHFNACSVPVGAKAEMNNKTIFSQLLTGIPLCAFYRSSGSIRIDKVDRFLTFPVSREFANNRLSSNKPTRSIAFLDYLRMQLDSHLSHFVTISSVQASHNLTSVNILISEIAHLLSKRFHFRQITEFLMREASKRDLIKGVRLSCSGRLGGGGKKAQKSKTQSFQWGDSSLHSFSSKISFASSSAATPFGKIGIKLWLSWQSDAVVCEDRSLPDKRSR